MVNEMVKNKNYIGKIKNQIIDITEHDHTYCIQCGRPMMYEKYNGCCFDCDNGIEKKQSMR